MKWPVILFFLCISVSAASQARVVDYPFPVHYFELEAEGLPCRMAYMDAQPASPNGKTVLLLHGKNFNGYYWRQVITFLNEEGFRVIVPDQVGWGRSDKPNIHYSFQLLASNTMRLLDSLNISAVHIVGHSMGGMLATRFSLMYPATVKSLVLENPIGLEDYRLFVPWQSPDQQFRTESRATYDSLKKYQQSYYPEWKPEYEQYVAAQYEALQYPDPKTATWASALTFAMICEQPVVYEFKHLAVPTLLLIGQTDRTIVGKNLLSTEVAKSHGNYPSLGKWLHGQIKQSELVEIPGVGHIPHVQVLPLFREKLLAFLDRQ